MLRAFYRVIAVGTIALLGLIFALTVIFGAFRIDPFYTMLETWSDLALLPFALIGAFFGIGVGLLWFGMMWDCAFTSKMRIGSKVLWLLLLIPTTYVGALIYYFCIYRNRPSGNPLAQDNRIPASIREACIVSHPSWEATTYLRRYSQNIELISTIDSSEAAKRQSVPAGRPKIAKDEARRASGGRNPGKVPNKECKPR